ncbi:nucleotidyltransferase family protein [Subtercola sp. RTI3]|nr:nucleotidyltransferase family protein [Subtercola sp. RTI3]
MYKRQAYDRRMDAQQIGGLLVAAGAGRRMGQPKALIRGEPGRAGTGALSGIENGDRDDETWVVRGVRVLLAAGCSPVVVVTGASGDAVERVVRDAFAGDERVVVRCAELWADGMSASLREGLSAFVEGHGSMTGVIVRGVVVTLVDLPDLGSDAVARVAARAVSLSGGNPGQVEAQLVRAVYGGRPGHPVFIGRAHWSSIAEQVRGDTGANAYLRANGVVSVECGDLGSGEDVDSRPASPER